MRVQGFQQGWWREQGEDPGGSEPCALYVHVHVLASSQVPLLVVRWPCCSVVSVVCGAGVKGGGG